MKLLIDSGATKADWIALDRNGKLIFITQTNGMNPESSSENQILKNINERFDISHNKLKVSNIEFYGAGCGTENMKSLIKKILNNYFVNATQILVEEDTYGALLATNPKLEKSIICILGTGSNCSYFDGTVLQQKVPSLGYLLMDYGSGNKLGADLVRAYNFNELSKALSKKLESEYNMDIDYIKYNLYKRPNPNAYLAKFAKFVIENREDTCIKSIIYNQLSSFIHYYIKQYKESLTVPIHFVGSIAFYLKDVLETELEKNKMKIGNVIRRPIEHLIDNANLKTAKTI